MAKQFDSLTPEHTAFIAAQHVFFVGTAATEGKVNVSPKGMDSLRVTGPNRLHWRNLSGSGNETAGHLRQVNRMTLMWCSFDKTPLILRAYGTANTIAPEHKDWDNLNANFPPDNGARQIYDMTIDLVQTSCGWAVPLMEHTAERKILAQWAVAKGPEEIRETWARDNQQTIDGFPTGIVP